MPIASRLAGTPFQLRRVEQRPRGLGSAPSRGAVSFALDDGRPQSVRVAVQDVVVGSLGSANSCIRPDGTPRSGYPFVRVVAASIIGDPTLDGANSPETVRAVAWLRTRTDEQRRSWLTRKATRIKTCSLTAADFT